VRIKDLWLWISVVVQATLVLYRARCEVGEKARRGYKCTVNNTHEEIDRTTMVESRCFFHNQQTGALFCSLFRIIILAASKSKKGLGEFLVRRSRRPLHTKLITPPQKLKSILLHLSNVQAAINHRRNCSDFRTKFLFHPSQRVAVIMRNEVDRQTKVPKATRSTDAMQVRLAVLGEVKVDYNINFFFPIEEGNQLVRNLQRACTSSAMKTLDTYLTECRFRA